jgi:hypothetical protein
LRDTDTLESVALAILLVLLATAAALIWPASAPLQAWLDGTPWRPPVGLLVGPGLALAGFPILAAGRGRLAPAVVAGLVGSVLGLLAALRLVPLDALLLGAAVLAPALAEPRRPEIAVPSPEELPDPHLSVDRAGMIAWYLKNNKPKSKILIFDPKETFSKQALFFESYEILYPGMIQWIGGKQGGKVTRVDPKAMTVEAEFGEEKGNVINVIPPQRAGKIAQLAGVTDDKGWCPIKPESMESAKVPGIYVVGDACIAGAMPKSGTAANSQARNAAAALVASLEGKPAPEPSYANTCYSIVAEGYGFSVTGVYAATPEGIKEIAGGVSKAKAPPKDRDLEAAYAFDWYRGIVHDALG